MAGDLGPFGEGEGSPSWGKSEIKASIRRMLTERAGLKLLDFLMFLAKVFDEFKRIRYTKA